MSTIDLLVQDFLAQKKIAVVGVSDRRETGCNLGYRKFKEAGYAVIAVNPRITEFEGGSVLSGPAVHSRAAGCGLHSRQSQRHRAGRPTVR